jgi:hypothetical protein
MSAEKLLATIGGKNKNIKALVPGQMELSQLYQEGDNYLKSKEFYARAHEYTKPLNNFGFSQSGNVTLPPGEIFVKNICLKVVLASGTYTTPPAGGYNLLDDIQVNIPGSQRQCVRGRSNFIVTMYEANSDSKRVDLINLAGGSVDVVNPANNVVYYIHLNILTSSMDEKCQQWYPLHLLNQNIDIQFKFKSATEFIKAGTAPAFISAELFYERANVFDMSKLKSKKSVYPILFRQIRDHEFVFNGSLTAPGPSIRLDGMTEDGELDQILIYTSIDSDRTTNKNGLTGAVMQNILAKLADREIVRGDVDFHSLLQLWDHKDQLKYTLAGNQQRFYNLPFGAVPYKKQQQERTYINGSDISQDDLRISFTSTAVASILYVIPIYKVLHTFHNGLQQHVR